MLLNVCGELGANLFPRNLFLSFSFFAGLIDFLSCRIGAYSKVSAYSKAAILQVIRYSDFCKWCKEK